VVTVPSIWHPEHVSIHSIRPGLFFTPVKELPRGRHALDPDVVKAAQCERLMAAFTELVADRGLADVTVADVVARASVSRAAFYNCFDDLSSCADAAYERFISVLLTRVADAMDPAAHWHAFVESAVRAYLEALQADPVVARAMQIEMDAAGRPARARRRQALKTMADVIAMRHRQFRDEDPTAGALPEEAFLGMVYAVRQLACDVLEDNRDADLLPLVEPTTRWIAASVVGAASVGAEASASG